MEAIMSSPIHFSEHADPALIDTRRSTRKRIRRVRDQSLRAGAAATRSSRKVKPKFSGDRAMVELQRRLLLEPHLIPEPTSEAAVMRPLLIRLCSVTSLAALVAWSLVSYSGVKKVTGNISAQTSAHTIASSHINVADVQRSQLRPSLPQTEGSISPIGKPRLVAIATADAGVGAPASKAVTAAPASESAPVGPASLPGANGQRGLQLDNEEIASLIKRGNDLIASGDLAAARLLLRRAAEAGSAEGALILATTFDPVALQRLGAIGATPDLAQARRWYQRAAELGSSAASQHLAGIAGAR
jgi:hypothetical protein